MPKAISIRVPTRQKDGTEGTEERRGFVALRLVGGVRHKFVLQFGPDGKPDRLTHHASGLLVGLLAPVKLRAVVAWGTASTPPTDRKAAELLLADLVATHGAATVSARLNAAPTLNT